VTLPKIWVYSSTNIWIWRLMWLVSGRGPYLPMMLLSPWSMSLWWHHSDSERASLASRIKRIQFKTLMITYKTLNGQAPIYLTELLHEKANTRTLRSSGEVILVVPNYKLQTYGLNVFSVATPTLWNKLPNFFLNMLKHSYSNKPLIVNLLIIFSHFVKHLFLLLYSASEQGYLVLALYKYTLWLLLLLLLLLLGLN